MKIVTSSQMQLVDRLTTEKFTLPSILLMETAGLSSVEVIEGEFPTAKHIRVFSGRGNNGGDGAVVARHLWIRGRKVELFLLGQLDETKGDARINFETVKSLSCIESRLSFQEISSSDQLQRIFSAPCDLYVDALFGTGASRPLTGMYADLVDLLNRSNIPIVSIDIPSGLGADSSEIIGTTVRAELTVTMSAPKIANILPPASHYNGKLKVVSIGSPSILFAESGSKLNLVEKEQITEFLKNSHRSSSAHKNEVGHVLLVAGGRGKTGAALLAAEAVLRAGAGLVTVATPSSCQQVLAAKAALEIMTEPVEETPQGTFADAAVKTVLELSQRKTLIAFGPGVGSDTKLFAETLLKDSQLPLLIDADGLNALAPWPEKPTTDASRPPVIITPHIGEMQRLLGDKLPTSAIGRADVVREFAVKNRLIVVLKGENSLIASPDGEVYVNPTGNAGMATAGSGDVLTGIASALLAQKPDQPLEAVVAAVYLHGLAGDLAAERVGQRSLIASDIIKQLPSAIVSLGGEFEKRNFHYKIG
ncbi:MAG: NAD(P)H-hydrate dehydratase [Blastocatellia bacterium]|nr:NAD(P)H-hydrate dehydratase [Blastocatellia bacterium]